MNDKIADAFRTISEVAEWLDIETHVLRFWESKFKQIKPVKRAGGRRYYRPKDMLIIGGIKKLLHEDGITIKGTQKIIKDNGLDYVSKLSKPLDTSDIIIEDNTQTNAKAISEPEIKSIKLKKKPLTSRSLKRWMVNSQCFQMKLRYHYRKTLDPQLHLNPFLTIYKITI